MSRFWFTLFILMPALGLGQDADLPLDDALLHGIDRLTIQQGLSTWTCVRQLPRESLRPFWNEERPNLSSSKTDLWYNRLAHLYGDSLQDSSRIKHWFLANGRDVVSYAGSNVQVYANPVLQFGGGWEEFSTRTQQQSQQILLTNIRGANLRVKLFGRVGLFTELLENQWLYPEYIRDVSSQRSVPPGAGFNKPYRERGFDFLNAQAYITYSPASFVRLKLGRDRVQYGPGLQSLLLSDWATDAYALQADWSFWKLRYHQRFAQLIDFIPGKADIAGDYPRKYGVWHQLAFKPVPQFELALFEGVIYADQLPNARRGFEFQYLNPLIFYRAAEQAVGSPDNGLLGAQLRIDLARKTRIYGQLVVDDFNFAQRKSGRYWWGNKYGWQLGAKYLDAFGHSGLDLQFECNRIRPYLYSHFNTAAAYAHFGQPLAHPHGANLTEFIIQIRWLISPRVQIVGEGIMLLQGIDNPGRNFGADLYRSNLVRDNGQINPDFDNQTLQGGSRQVLRANLQVSLQLGSWPAWIDGQLAWRQEQSSSSRLDWRSRSDFQCALQLRWNMPIRRVLY
jgi:hypothetical protein